MDSYDVLDVAMQNALAEDQKKLEDLGAFDEETAYYWRQQAKWLEQSLMSQMDKYAAVSAALGFEGNAWFGDPLASHEDILDRANELREFHGEY